MNDHSNRSQDYSYPTNQRKYVPEQAPSSSISTTKVSSANEPAVNSITPYFKLWDYKTNTITIPNKDPGAPLTSLELLQGILVDNDVGNISDSSTPLPSCLVPDVQQTQALVETGEQMALPIFNLGMPKCGSSTLHDFFNCAGIKSNHGQQGHCMQEAVLLGEPPIKGCKFSRKKFFGHRARAFCQLDNNFGPCAYPQISLLDEIHAEFPNATFVMNFRPVDDWIYSAKHFNGMASRWNGCKLPGLIKVGNRLTHQEIRNWLCGHVKHVREFVKTYPSHKLIELDLYDTEQSSQVMASLFQTDRTCWGHSNQKQTKTSMNNSSISIDSASQTNFQEDPKK